MALGLIGVFASALDFRYLSSKKAARSPQSLWLHRSFGGMQAQKGHGRSRRVRADSIHFNKSDFPLRASNPDTGILGRLKRQSICKTGC